MGTMHQVERKFTVAESFTLPAFSTVRGVASVSEVEERQLDAVYYDTVDLRLTRNELTLRRRDGGSDGTWQLQLPNADGDRDEIVRPTGDRTEVPPEFVDQVAVRARGAELHPVLHMRVLRRSRRLRDADGHDLVEIADDEVRAQTMGEKTMLSAWREVDVEVVHPSGAAVLAGACDMLGAAGARPGSTPSKLRRALTADESGTVGMRDVERAGRRLKKSDGAGAVVHAYLARHTEALLAEDPRVRRDAPEAVHDMRVAARRLRSTVRTFAPLFDPDRASAVEAGLAELGNVLSGPRDAEVQLARFTDQLAGQPDTLVLGPVAARVTQRLLAERLRGHDVALDYLRSDRYLSFVAELVAFVAAGVQTPAAAGAAGKVLPRLVRKADRKVRRRVERATHTGPGPSRDAAWHDARKSAKRLRYACEALVPVYGTDAATLGKTAKKIQNQLGAHQDCVVARTRLREFGVAANLAGESSFTYGLLTGDESARAARIVERFDADWPALARAKYRRWLE